MTAKHISNASLAGVFDRLRGTSVLGPISTEGLSWLHRVEAASAPSGSIVEALRRPRAAQSAKGSLLAASEPVGRYGRDAPAATATETAPLVLLGVRACELRALGYLDKVMLGGDFDDPTYRARREATTLVACDCAECAETCFCTLVGGRPFATEGFDVNLTPLKEGWLVEAAGEKGAKLLEASQLADAAPAQLAERDKLRAEITERVRSQNAKYGFSADDGNQPQLPEGNDDGWGRFAADCVECGACTNICPTCHCFYLYDHTPSPETFERVRTWDSCLFGTYHRMAGGVNMKLSPRPNLLSRLANRVLHKFTYSPQQYGLLGCVGCGRCIDACLGAIDIRDVVQELSK